MAKKRKLSPKARAAALRNLRKARAKLNRPKRRRVRAAVRAPRRRRVKMARKRRGGGRRRGFVLTPKKALQIAIGVDGAIKVGRQMANSYKADGDIVHATTGAVIRPGQKIGYDKEWAVAIAPGAIELIAGPKLAGKAVDFVAKSIPQGGRLANARIVRL